MGTGHANIPITRQLDELPGQVVIIRSQRTWKVIGTTQPIGFPVQEETSLVRDKCPESEFCGQPIHNDAARANLNLQAIKIRIFGGP